MGQIPNSQPDSVFFKSKQKTPLIMQIMHAIGGYPLIVNILKRAFLFLYQKENDLEGPWSITRPSPTERLAPLGQQLLGLGSQTQAEPPDRNLFQLHWPLFGTLFGHKQRAHSGRIPVYCDWSKRHSLSTERGCLPQSRERQTVHPLHTQHMEVGTVLHLWNTCNCTPRHQRHILFFLRTDRKHPGRFRVHD